MMLRRRCRCRSRAPATAAETHGVRAEPRRRQAQHAARPAAKAAQPWRGRGDVTGGEAADVAFKACRVHKSEEARQARTRTTRGHARNRTRATRQRALSGKSAQRRRATRSQAARKERVLCGHASRARARGAAREHTHAGAEMGRTCRVRARARARRRGGERAPAAARREEVGGARFVGYERSGVDRSEQLERSGA
jgi:hypothetical protein